MWIKLGFLNLDFLQAARTHHMHLLEQRPLILALTWAALKQDGLFLRLILGSFGDDLTNCQSSGVTSQDMTTESARTMEKTHAQTYRPVSEW